MKVELDYEGMGTCINCDFKIDGNRLFTIAASREEGNDLVRQVIHTVKEKLENDGVGPDKGSITDLINEIHSDAVTKGWWTDERSPLEVHMLCVSEMAEATECARNELPDVYALHPNTGELTDIDDIREQNLKPEGELIELADTVIRIMDYCGRKCWDLEEAIRLKVDYNKSRSYRHGNKKY